MHGSPLVDLWKKFLFIHFVDSNKEFAKNKGENFEDEKIGLIRKSTYFGDMIVLIVESVSLQDFDNIAKLYF